MLVELPLAEPDGGVVVFDPRDVLLIYDKAGYDQFPTRTILELKSCPARQFYLKNKASIALYMVTQALERKAKQAAESDDGANTETPERSDDNEPVGLNTPDNDRHDDRRQNPTCA